MIWNVVIRVGYGDILTLEHLAHVKRKPGHVNFLFGMPRDKAQYR